MQIRLKEIRESRDMTQSDIANQIGVSQQFISRVEKGNKSMTFDLAVEIADFLDVSLDEIAGRNKTAPDPDTKMFKECKN